MSLLRHHMSLESMLYEFHELWRNNYLSPELVLRSLGRPSSPGFTVPRVDRVRLLELDTYEMIVSELRGLCRPCPSPPVFRRSYLEVATTVDKQQRLTDCDPKDDPRWTWSLWIPYASMHVRGLHLDLGQWERGLQDRCSPYPTTTCCAACGCCSCDHPSAAAT